MEWADRLAEQRIVEAEREGALVGLKGEGKPLPIRPAPLAYSDELRLAARR